MLKFLLSALLVSLSWGSMAQADQTAQQGEMTWLYPDFPPYNIASGPEAGKGSADFVMKLMVRNIPGYQYHELVAPPPRVFAEMRKGANVCTPDLIKTPERETFITFSAVPALPPAIVTLTLRKSDWTRFGRRDSLSLEQVLEIPGVRVGSAHGRSYGTVVDGLLKKHADKVESRSGDKLYSGLLNMLLHRRIDAVLGMASEASFMTRLARVQDKVVIVPIKEVTPRLMGYVGCSNTVWGRAYIRHVDRVLKRERLTQDYRHNMERWMSRESLSRVEWLYDSVFLDAGH